VRAEFLRMAAADPRMHVIDAAAAQDEVAAQVRRCVFGDADQRY